MITILWLYKLEILGEVRWKMYVNFLYYFLQFSCNTKNQVKTKNKKVKNFYIYSKLHYFLSQACFFPVFPISVNGTIATLSPGLNFQHCSDSSLSLILHIKSGVEYNIVFLNTHYNGYITSKIKYSYNTLCITCIIIF